MRSTKRAGFSHEPADSSGDSSGDPWGPDDEEEGSAAAMPDPVECAAYISDLSGALAGLARRAGMRRVALFLRAAESEALIIQSNMASGRHDAADHTGTDAT